MATLAERLSALCESIATAFGATARCVYTKLYPATINSLAEARFAGDVAESLVGADRVIRLCPTGFCHRLPGVTCSPDNEGERS